MQFNNKYERRVACKYNSAPRGKSEYIPGQTQKGIDSTLYLQDLHPIIKFKI